ncbi:oligosaccharide flippase family protein [uncultured Erythrobacter sp.]|uniref:oligosaccharide flippase family protein n=1 Tax=uncultured Erythrobacter sp. TaxID=263913 RepID=UPI002628A65D|nr:oligosaccharide flippase family protein [uncultured Erythrobacter sp.]
MFNTVRTWMTPDAWPAFARGMLAYGSAEAATRIVRLGAILVVARQISPELLGTAALALSLFELVRVLTSVGIGQRIIVATENELASVCNAAFRLFWGVCLSVMAIQLIVAAFALAIFPDGGVAMMLAVLSAVYLFMPAGLVQIFLAMRAQRMAATARVAAMQNMADAALTVVLVLVWPSAWAIVLPKLLTAPLWLVAARRTYRWAPDRCVQSVHISEFAEFGPAVLGSELLAAARLHGDKLLVGALLGTDALGLYYFAFNAGLGITQSFVAACNIVLFPHLAKSSVGTIGREFRRSFTLGFLVLCPVVLAQALLAPWYVPVIFGANWIEAAPYIALLAGAALPLYAGAILGARSRAVQKPLAETSLMGAATFAALVGLAAGAQISLAWACAGFSLGLSTILLPAAAIQLFASTKPAAALA